MQLGHREAHAPRSTPLATRSRHAARRMGRGARAPRPTRATRRLTIPRSLTQLLHFSLAQQLPIRQPLLQLLDVTLRRPRLRRLVSLRRLAQPCHLAQAQQLPRFQPPAQVRDPTPTTLITANTATTARRLAQSCHLGFTQQLPLR